MRSDGAATLRVVFALERYELGISNINNKLLTRMVNMSPDG